MFPSELPTTVETQKKMLAKSLGTLLVICALFVVGLYAQVFQLETAQNSLFVHSEPSMSIPVVGKFILKCPVNSNKNILLQVLDITSSPNRVLYQVCYDKEKAIPQFTFHYLDDKCSSSGLVRPDVDPWYTVADVTDGTGRTYPDGYDRGHCSPCSFYWN